MDDTTQSVDRPGSLSTLTSWERWVETSFSWMPYVSLGISLIVAQIAARSLASRSLTVGLAVAAAIWTWAMFTRHGSPMRLAQPPLRFYFVGFVVFSALLILREPVFLVYGITGFFHASLLRPWSIAFVAIATTALVIHAHIVIDDANATNWAIYLGVVTIQAVAVAAGLYAGDKITEVAEGRRQTLERLELAIEENEGLHAQLVTQAREAGVLDERQRMAREIHDTIAQGLTGVITQIEAAVQSWSNEGEMQRHLTNAAELARESLTEARRSVQAIRPQPLDSSRLPEALGDIASRWSEVTGVAAQVRTTGDRRPLRPEVEVTLLRAAQEGLANIAKHAAASRAGVTLSFMDDSVTLDIRDDGAGFDTSGTKKEQSFGLAAMRQRVAIVSGVMQIESAPGDGTAVSVRVPTAMVGSSNG